MKNRLLPLLVLLLAATLATKANPVDMRTVREVAVKFVNANTRTPLRGAEDLQLVTTYRTESDDAAFHIFNTPNGFVIVAADNVAHPILAYSLDRPWPSEGNLPLQVTGYLDDLANQIEAASNQPQDRGIASEWSDLLSGHYQTRGDRTQVGPLLTTTWDQGQYYNAMCPEDENGSDGHALTGCVATAMAQIIKYWGYPIQGRGSHSYNLSGLDPGSMGYQLNDYGTLSVNFDSATYEYNHMPDVLSSESTQEEIDAVAQLMYHCGVAVNMEYGPSASGAREEDVRSALISYFGFDHTLGYAQRQLYTFEEWTDSLRANIDRSEPVFYCGSSLFSAHAFVLDGYQEEDYFHFNFGWSGDCDGWFLTTAINVGFGFNEWQSAIMGIRPNNEEHAVICHRIMYVQSDDYFTVTEPIDLYPMRGGSVYRAANEMIGTRLNLNYVPEDESGQLVLDVLEFDNEQSVVIYDGINKDSLVRVIETGGFGVYEGNLSDTIFQNIANSDFSPIVSTRHGFTVVVYTYGGITESFHLRVSDASDCRMVSNLTAVQDSDGVLVSWTENGEATQWQVMVEDASYNCNETHIMLTELLPEETYVVKVRAICDEQHASSWNSIVVNKKIYWTDVVKSEPEGYLLDVDTIRIISPEGLAWMAHCIDSLYLTGTDWQYYQYIHRVISFENDLDLSGYFWNPIRCWFGNVNGNGHVINNMEVSTSSREGGLFTGIWNSEITDIKMTNSKVNSVKCAGSIAGYIDNCIVNNCSSENYLISVQNSVAGGLFGTINECQIKNCHAYGNNYSQFGYGGLVGSYNNSEMTNCVTQLGESFNWGSIFASAEWRGLLTEEVHGGSFSNCFSDISNAKWYNSDPETYRYYFLGNIYNLDAIDNLAAFNISIDPLGMLIADTAVNYTLGENIDVVTALNNMVAEYNLPDLRTWVRDEVTHMPVLGDYFEVTCPNVSDITIENIAYNDGFAVVLSWQENGAAEEWQVKYKMQNVPDSSATVYNISMTNDTIEGLQLGNMYEFYVRPICGDEPTVGWGQPYSFFVDKALWVDVVTECPEGYFEDSDGNVTISSPEGLAWLAKIGFNYRNDTISIANDLDMGAYKWTPIGRESFAGTVEGNNHVISNIYCSDDLTNIYSTGIGLIAHAQNATLNNIVIQNSSFTGNRFVGSLVGYMEIGTINNCHAFNVIVKGVEDVGGLGGCFPSCETRNCSSSGYVYADFNEGGLIGNCNGVVSNCYSNCYVRPMGNSDRVFYGGLFGGAVGIAENCYSSGDLEAGTNDTWDKPGGRLVGWTQIIGNHLYARNNSELPLVERVEDGVLLSDTASFNNAGVLNNSVTIGETSYTNLLDALNAWVDANNTEGQYLHWVADTAMVNGGFPVFEQIPMYDIFVSASPAEGGIVTGAGSYPQGSTCTLTATANEGYTFVNWTKDDEIVSTEPTYSFTVTEASDYVANFELNTYDITATANPTEGGAVDGSGTYDHFSTCTLTATANTGYTFLNWTLDGEVVTSEPTYSFEVDGPANYVANFELNTYEITAMANPEAGGTVEGAGVYDHGATATLTATANEGYTFINWTKNGEEITTSTTYSFTVTEAGDYVANFELNTYEITVTANPEVGGEVTGSGTYSHGETVTLTATTNEGYTFINWTQDGEEVSTETIYSFIVTEAADYVANFEMNTYEITATANPEAGGTINGTGTYTHGETATLTATANEGYTFINWMQDGEEVSTETTYSFTVTEAGDYVANFELNSYTITATANPEVGGEVTGAGTYSHGETATLTATANEGYTFINWTQNGDEVSTEAIYSFTVTVAADYVANFELNTYEITVTVNPTEAGEVTGSGTYSHGETVTLTATTNEGYTFINWTQDGEEVSTDASYSFEATEDLAFVANFELNTYEITATANPEAGGEVTGAGTYSHGETTTLTATANAGYTFINWTQNGEEVSTEVPYSFTVTEAGDYVANFELNTYEITVTANPEVGGEVTGAGTYSHGETATLTATANAGYTFINWTQNGEEVSTEATYSFTVTETADYVANFELNTYEITVTANPEAGGEVTGAGTYSHGETTTLTATANEGYTFINWTQNGEIVSTEATYSFEVEDPADYVANFELNTYEITVTANPTEGGEVAGIGTYSHGETATLTATANEGYTFINWTQNGEEVSTEAIYSFTVTEAADYVANFEMNTYEITATANPEAGGTINGTGTYTHGETATLTATANEGYTFINWTKDGEEVSTETTYSFTVTETGDYVAHFELTAITQVSGFVQGWNWWSSYVELDGASSLQSLQNGLGTSGMMIKSQNDGYASYLAGFGWYGSLTTINNENTYQIRANEPCSVEMTGAMANPVEHPITLNTGWTWVGYPVAVSMGVEDALAGISPLSGDMLKSQNNGYASYLDGFGWYGSLNTLEPGMGLMFKSNNSSNITLTYPNNGTRTDLKANQTADNNHWRPNLNAYPDNMSVMAVVELDGNELQGENYELAAFANGEVRGSARLLYVKPLNRYMAFLTVAGDEPAELHFGLYNTGTGEVEAQCITSLQYETNAVVGSFAEPYVVRFRGNTGVDEWANNLNVFPNPVERGQKVSLGFNDIETDEVQVEIINALGAIVETRRAAPLQTITAPETAGVYTLRITVEGKGTCYRKLVVR